MNPYILPLVLMAMGVLVLVFNIGYVLSKLPEGRKASNVALWIMVAGTLLIVFALLLLAVAIRQQ